LRVWFLPFSFRLRWSCVKEELSVISSKVIRSNSPLNCLRRFQFFFSLSRSSELELFLPFACCSRQGWGSHWTRNCLYYTRNTQGTEPAFFFFFVWFGFRLMN
jgi:hypothetical protein